MQIKEHYKKIIFFLVIINLIAVFNIFAQKETVFIGKIVDAKGKPAAADILIPCGDLVLTAQSEQDGRFQVSYPHVCEGILWVTSQMDHQNWGYPFSPGFNLPDDYYKQYKSVASLINGEQEKVDLGEVSIQVYFGKIKILVDKKDAAQIFASEGSNLLRIRDKSGDLIYENTISKGLNEQESSINIALPYGTYKLEIKNSNFDWQALAGESTISGSEPIILKFAPKNMAIIDSPTFKNLLNLNKSVALKEIKKRSFAFTTNEFEKKLYNGNIEAVILYLKAGLSPNIRFEHGFTPLMMATDYPDIIELLVKNGANVNLQSDNFTIPEGEEGEPLSETTSLMMAVGRLKIESVRILLQNGALPNITNTFGETALKIAVDQGDEDIVQELLKFGANPNVKDRKGKFLIDVAKENSDWEIVKILEKALGNQK